MQIQGRMLVAALVHIQVAVRIRILVGSKLLLALELQASAEALSCLVQSQELRV
jgi:hypothetical protein